MEQKNDLQRISSFVEAAMLISTDPVTAAGAAHLPLLKLTTVEQAMQLARCIAVFTTDDALADELEGLLDESPAFLASKVMAVRAKLEKFTGVHAELENQIWTLIYAGRRERSRVMQTLARRKVL